MTWLFLFYHINWIDAVLSYQIGIPPSDTNINVHLVITPHVICWSYIILRRVQNIAWLLIMDNNHENQDDYQSS